MELKTTEEGKLDLDSTMIEKIKEISVDVQQKELLNILKDKEDAFEDNMNKYEQRMEELKKELALASVPNKPQQKLTTYTLRRIIRDFENSIRNAENQLSTLEKTVEKIPSRTTE
ncbi:uncharacterized protein RHIMIDRAFT_106537 [Rhizopus microsporus ATCC 52813]|uniref:Uncharacterized protein n=2 Tax=Rhizopus microsporus TaxID=58291 RepID=A0A2G4T1E9_RHIZD|nr:uncharacterized protein RHIMIDRAFT_106537 [Rhizopus microsporus ATCC 52813]PHZ14824.1 hypothetical protein RHIMIDRAFT_106537 [Rhizopus microsporus ATCC 52813]